MNKLILLILLITGLLLTVILYKYINYKLEGFTSSSKQNGNLLKIINTNNSSIQNIKNSAGSDIKLVESELEGLFNITDIKINNITGKVRIGFYNKSKNEINYVSFNDSALDITDKMTLNIDQNYSLHNIKNPYGSNIIADSIKIFLLDNQYFTDLAKIEVCGVLSTQIITKKDLDILYKDAKELDNSGETITTINIESLQSINTTNKLYKITSIEINDSVIPTNEELELTIRFANNYTNELMIYKSDRQNGKFLVSSNFKNIYLYDNILLVNKLAISYIDGDSEEFLNANNCIIRGYNASNNDITAFKLENGLTDIRGSINPDDICPGIDGLINDQLSSEVIIDSLDYQEKIKDEKIKLQSNKDALLNLLEQKEKISSVAAMINKIEELQKKRDMETDSLNAIRLTKQIDEINKLKEVLDARIEENKKNTITFDKIRVNNIKRLDTSSRGEDIPEVEGFIDITLPEDENMHLV